MYVASRGGEAAIEAAHAWLARVRRGEPSIPEIEVRQIRSQLGRAVDRVMAEGSLHDPELAALAIKQAQGDLVEAAFLLRALRTSLPRFAASVPVDTGAMLALRRISAIYKDLPGGQVLGPTTDYTHRLLDFALLDPAEPSPPGNAAPDDARPPQAARTGSVPADARPADARPAEAAPRVMGLLDAEGLMEPSPACGAPPGDLTREPLLFPAARPLRLQALARGDEGFLLALGYSTQRGHGNTHPFVGELRVGEVAVEIVPPELGFAVEIGTITLTECEMVNQFAGSLAQPPQFTRGYGLCFGHGERKAMGMALVDRALRSAELGEDASAPAQDAEFVLSHCDNIEATGFVEHLKLPHYVDFQSELEAIRRMRAAAASARPDGQPDGSPDCAAGAAPQAPGTQGSEAPGGPGAHHVAAQAGTVRGEAAQAEAAHAGSAWTGAAPAGAAQAGAARAGAAWTAGQPGPEALAGAAAGGGGAS